MPQFLDFFHMPTNSKNYKKERDEDTQQSHFHLTVSFHKLLGSVKKQFSLVLSSNLRYCPASEAFSVVFLDMVDIEKI